MKLLLIFGIVSTCCMISLAFPMCWVIIGIFAVALHLMAVKLEQDFFNYSFRFSLVSSKILWIGIILLFGPVGLEVVLLEYYEIK